MNAIVDSRPTFTADEHILRRSFIGGSEAASALGLNPYESPFALWQVKCGIAPPFEGNEITLWGKLLEPVIRQQYSERTGRIVRLPIETIIHAEHRFMACHPDGVTEDGRLYEGKTSRRGEDFGEEGSPDVPEHYKIQCQHNMLVTELKVTDLNVLIGGNEMHTYVIGADPVVQKRIIEAEAAFWGHVVRREPPPIDFTRKDAIEVVKAMYPGTNGEILEATGEMIECRTTRENATELVKANTAVADEMKARMLAFMGEATFLRFGDGYQFRRKLISKDAYQVRASSYMDFRKVKA